MLGSPTQVAGILHLDTHETESRHSLLDFLFFLLSSFPSPALTAACQDWTLFRPSILQSAQLGLLLLGGWLNRRRMMMIKSYRLRKTRGTTPQAVLVGAASFTAGPTKRRLERFLLCTGRGTL
ncbi:hypothetical protein M406DRAFT_100957 [Cryphonectria parasitica EP155]|uniref:Uncharacterized protein n=1 Tax=Cryphonectria parasitica (strain ATCC 38755 / EP155) TaxID=660469 RepID=A0A9P4YDJ8_CRYP1|nr:uncharacterized protein M406DRAFT_100957 [Cryphonectria parasitica EP155]KAF3770670.1 hypothetical protein M406DRAFT_100957 [Cryphonectria parasitica EP155]